MLSADGRSGQFAGGGTACFLVSDLEWFAHRVGEYPLSATSRLEVRGGYFSSSTPSTLDQEHLALYVYPTNLRGGVAIQLRATTALQAGERAESQSRAAFEIHVTYEALRLFSRCLKELLQGSVAEAIIEGTERA